MDYFDDLLVLCTGWQEMADLPDARERIDYGFEAVKKLGTPMLVMHGGQRGADTLCEEWAKRNAVPYLGWPARWSELGKQAGTKRNFEMADFAAAYSVPFRVSVVGLAFPAPTSKGTRHMMSLIRHHLPRGWQLVTHELKL